jgi:hypothetical protein
MVNADDHRINSVRPDLAMSKPAAAILLTGLTLAGINC